ncbi:MAG: Sensory box/GGDEF family protein [Parcubacteria bacterium C7867-005]|nr:MAG: Sensory box/GGDEF family protein [Parcubacteria bacterium C7867-005]
MYTQRTARALRQHVDLIVLAVTLGTVYVVWRWFIIQNNGVPTAQLNGYFGIGILISFLIYSMVYGLSSANVRAEKIASDMTVDLQKYKVAVENTSGHIVIVDKNGIVVYMNGAAERLTGFSKEESIGKNLMQWMEHLTENEYVEMFKSIVTKKDVFRVEMVNKKKSGDIYTAQISISPIFNEETEEIVGFVEIENDITEIKNMDKLLTDKNTELERVNKLMVGREIKMADLKAQITELENKLH